MRESSSRDFEYPAHVPTMISPAERRYLFELARSLRGRGHVVEIGPWLGGSTVCLAAGLSSRRAKQGAAEAPWRVHAFDSFVWRPFMAERAPLGLEPGDSFLPAFRQNVAPWEDLVVAHRATLPDEIVRGDPAAEQIRDAGAPAPATWRRDDPIELLFVDGAKSWTAMRYVLGTFGPALVEGGWLVLQDYRFWGAWWVASMLELVSECLELERIVPANTVTFRVIRPLDDAALGAIPEWSELHPDRAEELLEAAVRRLADHGDAEGARIVALARVRLRVHAGRPDRAREAFRRQARRWPLLADDRPLEACRRWLEDATAEPVLADGRTRMRRALRPLRRMVARLRT